MSKWYGSINNRLEENRMYTDRIEVGTGMTEYSWSDREAYEVVEVKDQKHIAVRRLDHKAVGECMSNEWELTSNEDNPIYDMTKRGNYWYWTSVCTAEEYDRADDITKVQIVLGGFDPDVLRAKGKQTKYRRANVSFGVADYYYDYSF